MLPNERTTRDEIAAAPGVVEGLVVAPDRDAGRPLIDFLRAEGVNVQVVNSADQGFEEALLHRPNVVVIHAGINKAGGVDLCERLKANARTHFLPVVLFSLGKASDWLRLDATAAGADALFSSSTSKEERRARLWALLRSQAMYRRLDGKRQAQNCAISNKRRWVRGLVHDIQNSLGAIQANFEFLAQQIDLRNSKQREDVEECIQETRSTVREMVRNLRTVLEYERFEAGDAVLNENRVLLSEVNQGVAASLHHLASSLDKEILIDEVGDALPITGDENYLREAVAGLATYVLRQPDNKRCQLSSTSLGGIARLRVCGDKHVIPEMARAGLFDPYHGHPKDKPTHAAHRVGLALAKIIVELHHGAIWVDDLPGAGSAFVLEFSSPWTGRGQRSSE